MEYTTFYLPDGLWSLKMSKIMLSNDFSYELDDSWSESLFETAISAGIHSCAKYSVSFQQLLAHSKLIQCKIMKCNHNLRGWLT